MITQDGNQVAPDSELVAAVLKVGSMLSSNKGVDSAKRECIATLAKEHKVTVQQILSLVVTMFNYDPHISPISIGEVHNVIIIIAKRDWSNN